ncbi:MAG: ABC transporter substrate-binding protein [Chloroflexi bacterium]|nr:ABC transporter substrate-binding protein [Chloroflexota bacterium]
MVNTGCNGNSGQDMASLMDWFARLRSRLGPGIGSFVVSLFVLGLLLISCSAQPSAPAAATAAPAAAPTVAAAPPAAPAPKTAPAAAPTPVTKAAPAQAASAGGGTLRVGLRTDLDILDPHVMLDGFIVAQMINAYEGLIDIAPSGKVEPALATSWDISPDGLVYTFKLRPNVNFTDGTPFNAEAAKFSIERLLKLKKGNVRFVDPVKTVEALGTDTLRLTLKAPYGPFLRGLWVVWMVSPTAVQKNTVGDDSGEKWLNEHTAGTGPYKLDSITRGSQMVFSRNAGYWRGWQGPHFDRVELKAVREPGTHRLMMERGDLDISLLFTSETLKAFRANPAIQVYKALVSDQHFMFLQMKDGPTTKPQVRQALNYLWDPDTYSTLMEGELTASPGPLATDLLSVFGTKVNFPYRYDPAKAKQLLSEAGFPDGRGLKLKIALFGPDAVRKPMAELYQQILAKAGIQADIELADWAAIRKIMVDYAKTGDPALHRDIFPFAVISRTGDPRELFKVLYHSGSAGGVGNNYTSYANPKVDDMIDRALSTTDEKEAASLVQQITQTLIDDAPAIFGAAKFGAIPLRKEIKGYAQRPLTWELLHWYELYR